MKMIMLVTKMKIISMVMTMMVVTVVVMKMYLLFPESRQRPELELSQSPPTLWNTLRDKIKSAEHIIGLHFAVT